MEKKNVKSNQEQGMIVLKVTRELLDAKTKSGQDMYRYVLREKIQVNGKEREIRVDFAAKDVGGYDVLDLIFMYGEEAYLDVHEEYMSNDKTGETVPYKVYEIWNEDEDGIVYSYKVKPMRESDKSKLDVVIQKRVLEYEKSQKAAEATTKSGSQAQKA